MNESTNGINIVLMSQKGNSLNLWLPEKPEGIIVFNDFSENLYFAEKDNHWVAVCKNPYSFYINGQNTNEVLLDKNQLIYLFGYDQKYALYIDILQNEKVIFRNYKPKGKVTLSIGRSLDNDIIYNNKMISSHHSVLSFDGFKNWSITDLKSGNGTYVNQKRIIQKRLNTGDHIYILGLEIIIGTSFLSINDSRKMVYVHGNNLNILDDKQVVDKDHVSTQKYDPIEIYNRKPRHRTAFIPQDIEIDSPPMPLGKNGVPLLLRFGGSAVMSGSAALRGNYIGLVSSLLMPMLNTKYTEKEKKEYESKRIKLYSEYLNNKEREIIKEKNREEQILNTNYPSFSDLLEYPIKNNHLWERRTVDDDFLHLRLGFGKRSLCAEIKYQKKKFNLEEDPLEEDMRKLGGRDYSLENVPITVSLIDNYVIGLSGEKVKKLNFLRILITQICILHSYDEVKIILLAENDDMQYFNDLKYLPHLWDDHETIRFIGNTNRDGFQISEYLKSVFESDKDNLKEILKKRPYYIVISTSKSILDSMESLKSRISNQENTGVSFICAYKDSPKDCSLLLELLGENKAIYLKDIDKSDDVFVFDQFDPVYMKESIKLLSNKRLSVIEAINTLPKSVKFLEMYGVKNIDQLLPQVRWQENDPSLSLEVPVGIASDGSVFTLDLHEKHQGPHGLVAGTTGSGKSEFLITYILSMAINFHPDEVAFVLIDYKGGGLAGAFVDKEKGLYLPHVIGTITNLDGSSIQRSLISLESEVKRRQAVFNHAKSIASEGTMDIYTYQRLYRKRILTDPMPHLFIISDEFAELKQQQPEFMNQLISIARIGRSLGVHLILATQKPAGIVNDQIRSNAKFKVCLKVQDKADSIDMLQRPEAAELKDVGRFYLQVGNNESFTIGQSGWSGAEYIIEENKPKEEEFAIQYINSVGQSIYSEKKKVKNQSTGQSQLVAIVKKLSEIGKKEMIVGRKLWEPELPQQLPINTNELLRPDNEISVYLGEMDDPRNQRQIPFIVNINTMKNLLIVGQPGSGKTTFLQTLLYLTVKTYTPEEFQYYAIDLSEGGLKSLSSAPHCGGIILDGDEQQLRNLFGLLDDLVADRKKKFSELDVQSFEAASKIQKMPIILMIIDNISSLNNSKIGEKYYYDLSSYLKNTYTYGIRFIATCNHSNEVMGKIRQEFLDRIALSQKDKYDYGDVIGCRCDYTPPSNSGRGLYKYNDSVLEVQFGSIRPDLNEKEFNELIRLEMKQLNTSFSGKYSIKRLPKIDKDQSYFEFCDLNKKYRIPLGYNLKNNQIISIPYKQWSAIGLFFGKNSLKQIILKNLLYVFSKDNAEIYAFSKVQDSLFNKEYLDLLEYEMQLQVIKTDNYTEILNWLLNDYADEIKRRKDVLDKYCLENQLDSETKDIYFNTFKYIKEKLNPLIVIIEDLNEFCGLIENDTEAERIFSMIIKLFKRKRKYNVHFILGIPSNTNTSSPGQRLYSELNENNIALFFGGSVDKQNLVRIPMEYNNDNIYSPINRFLIDYSNQFNILFMPFKLPVSQLEEDDEPIF